MPESSAAHWRLIGSFLAPHRRAMAGFSVLVLLAGTLPLAGPVLLGAIADGVTSDATVGRLVLLAAGLGLVGILANGADLTVTWLGARLAWRAANELRVQVAAHALGLGSAWHGRTTPGEVVDRVDGDATRVGELLARVVVRLAAALVTLAGVVVLLVVQDWRLGAALGVVLVAGGWVLVRLRDLAVPSGVVARQRTGEVFGAAEERLRGAEELRALGGGRYAVADLRRRSALTIAPWRRQEVYATAIWSTSMLVVVGGGAVALLGGILLQRSGAMSIGQVLAAFTATQLTRRPLEQLAENIQEIQQAGAGASRLATLLAEVPLVRFTGDRELPGGPLEIALEGVRAGYPGMAEDALGGIDLQLAAGEHLGVVGASGGGKTTLTRLLHRALDPRDGVVRLGGIDLREVSEASLRRRVAVVTQEVQLLSASIRDNLTLLGTVTTTDADLVAALDAVGMGDWFKRLDEGLDARLGDDAGTSAGEAQLLALARVLLRDPGLVILDEPTARLDTASAMAVTRALDALLVGRSAVVVAHRLATLERVDRIAVVRHGRIVEQGSRASLLRDDTRFARLVEAELGNSS
ncbi:MAG TPA: ABC transporter ATP-binding protein [Egicoccus sp.]|nr:ABC transporter ATP-binding protein [Egicoccus sp.]HSK22747.1 ABC transporter ATP-binding protein [Egicoccus sp.]